MISRSDRQLPVGIPRFIEVMLAGVGLAATVPLIAVAGMVVRATSSGPAFFRQKRVGRGGKAFVLYKLRTMRASSIGPQVTARGDERITRVGRLLRRSKLDELPQLWNVVRGDMSLVGPRPEVPQYVSLQDPAWRRVLLVRPGITDPVTLQLRDEESLLEEIGGDRERFYREELLPRKLSQYAAYLDRRTGWTDVEVLYKTVIAVLWTGRVPGAHAAGTSKLPTKGV